MTSTKQCIIAAAAACASWTANIAVLYAASLLNKASAWLPEQYYGQADLVCWSLIGVAALMLPLPFALVYYITKGD